MIQIETKHYKRITKHHARKRYADGKPVYFCPCAINPENLTWGVWNPSSNNIDFEKLVAEYRFYNCDCDRGYYVNFYIKKSEEKQK